MRAKGDNDYSYMIDFSDIRKGFFCSAYLIKETDEEPIYNEHIVGGWYYASEQGE